MNNTFLMLYSPKPQSQVRILARAYDISISKFAVLLTCFAQGKICTIILTAVSLFMGFRNEL